MNKIQDKNTFKIKRGYYLDILTTVTMKFFGNTKSKITKHENSENLTHLKIVEVVLARCNIVNNDY